MAEYKLKWRPPGPIGSEFVKHRPKSDGNVVPMDIIRGPIGGGKSVACAIRMFCHMMEQEPGQDGWRKSRWAILRNTNPQLETTTIKTWLEWFPEEHFGPFRWAKPYLHRFRFPAAKVESEIWFAPLDDEKSVRNVLGLELTGIWVNEMREMPRELVVAARSRVGRYPSRRDGGAGPTWAGVIADTNSPDEDSYLAMWEGVTEPPEWMDPAEAAMMSKPPGVNFFIQPPGLLPIREKRSDGKSGPVMGWKPNPKAENAKHLPPGYYEGQISGNTTAWLLTMCANEYGGITAGRVVYDDFDANTHVADSALEYSGRGRLVMGADFARNPALVVGEELDGQLRVLREFIGINVSTRAFFEDVVPQLNVLFPAWEKRYQGWGDPAGSARTGGDETTMFSHAREAGLALLPGSTNDPDKRQAAVERRLTRIDRGRPALLISPTCRTLIQGFKGGYKYPEQDASGREIGRQEPVKNLYSHVHDALQYLTQNVDRAAHRPPGSPVGTVRAQTHFDPRALARQSRIQARR